jgi:hypothetical protein
MSLVYDGVVSLGQRESLVTFLNSLSNVQWGLALAVPIGILLLYFLKLRRRPVEVASTLLWRKSIEDLRVNSLWQRLRQSLLLWLQLAFAGLLLLALLGPTWNVVKSGKRFILMVDQSASMRTKEKGGSRLELAKERAKGIVDQMKPGDAGMVIAFGRSARVLASYTEERDVLRQAIDSIEPTSQSTDLREALSIASALANPQRILERPGDAEVVPLELSPVAGQEATVHLLSDGNFPDASEFSLGNLSVEYTRIGDQSENVGIMAMSYRPKLDEEGGVEVFARLRNFSNQPVPVTIELFVDGKRADLRRMELSAGVDKGISFSAVGGEVEQMNLVLSPGDAFDLDDTAWLVVAPPKPVRVLRIGPANPLLDAVLSTPAFAKFASVESLPESEKDRDLSASTEEGRYDLVIFDRCRPAVMPSCNTWMIGAMPRDVEGAVEVRGATILNWDSVHPVLRFLQIDDVSIVQAIGVPAGTGRVSLIETDQGLVMWMEPRGVYNDLVLSVPLVDADGQWQTDWPLKPSFPLLVMNILRFQGEMDTDRGRNLRVGNPIVVRQSTGSPTVTTPAGEKFAASTTRPGVWEFLDTDQTGFYEISGSGEKERAAVNLFDEAESRIAPKESISIGSEKAADVGSNFRTERELWRWLALAGLGLLVAEWYIYNKRVYI